MDAVASLGEFLRMRRARVRPEDTGLPSFGRRRVHGLRREEVATLAGISTTWYTRFERGRRLDVSPAVIRAIARALRLSSHETAYLYVLAGAVIPIEEVRVMGAERAGDLAVRLAGGAPRTRVCYDESLTIVAIDALGARLFGYGSPERATGVNPYERVFREPWVRERVHNWAEHADHAVAVMRYFSGRGRGDPPPALRDDPEFARRWARHDVHSDLGRRFDVRIRTPDDGLVDLISFGLLLPGGGRLLVHFPADAGSEARLAAMSAASTKVAPAHPGANTSATTS